MWAPFGVFAGTSPKCEIKTADFVFDLQQPSDSRRGLKSLLRFLKSFDTSQTITKDFSERLESEKISVLPFFERPGLVANAVGFFDIETNAVYLNKGEFGVLALNFFHEMVHSGDKEYAERVEDWKNDPQPRKSDFMVFAAERKAYDEQRKLIEELFKKSPCSRTYFQFHEDHGNVVVSALSDKDIANHYKLNPEWIK